MPFFNNRPKKHCGINKPEAKMPIIVAQKAPAHHLLLTMAQVDRTLPSQSPSLSVN